MNEDTKYLLDKIDNLQLNIYKKIDDSMGVINDKKQDKSYCKENCTNISLKKLSGSVGGIVLLIIAIYEGLQQGGVL